MATRDPRPEDGAVMAKVVLKMDGQASVGELVERSALGGYGYDAVVRALVDGHLRLCPILQARIRHAAYARAERQSLSSPCTKPYRRWRMQHRGRRHAGTAWSPDCSQSIALDLPSCASDSPCCPAAAMVADREVRSTLNSRHRQAAQRCLLRAKRREVERFVESLYEKHGVPQGFVQPPTFRSS